MNILLVVIMSISLSMDAFSLSLAYGTIGLTKKQNIILSIIVGFYHFVMPLIGLLLGNIILTFIKINPSIIVFIVLTFIGIEMILESYKKKEKINKINIIEMIVFGFAVSIDSFSVGIGIKALKVNPIICSFIFSLFSLLFTLVGLNIGCKINNLIGKASTFIGGITLIILGIIYIL